jgi:hypothetical protein
MAAGPRARYDVFLSLGGLDRASGRRLAAHLRVEGLRVFVDEDDIEFFKGITQQIHDALSASKVLVVYYSCSYSLRPSCQLELTAAFLAGQSQGNPVARIVVVNPEETTAHLQPAELADARFISTSVGLDQVARAVRNRVRSVEGVIGDAGFRRSGAHHGRIPGTTGFVGQYRRHWELHSALHADDLAMTQEPAHGPVVAVGGLPGVGKTTFVAAYAWRFGAAFPGGVFWTRLTGDSLGARRRYDEQLAETAWLLGLPTSTRPSRLRGMLAEWLGERGRTLWIVDDVPTGVDPDIVHDLVLPAGPALRTVLMSNRDVFGDKVPLIRLDGLSAEDASALLESCLPAAGPEERAARDSVVARLGGHGSALTEVARLLRDSGGEISYQLCETMIARNGVLPSEKWKTTHAASVDLSPVERFILRLSAVSDFAPVDVASMTKAILRDGLARVHHEAVALTVSGLRALEARYLAARTKDGWRIHPLAPRLTDVDNRPSRRG